MRVTHTMHLIYCQVAPSYLQVTAAMGALGPSGPGPSPDEGEGGPGSIVKVDFDACLFLCSCFVF
jgi:hypothetical protein